jgi:hypothetical protein
MWLPVDHSTALVATPLFGFILLLITRLAQRTSRNLPPGPKGLPIVGDVRRIVDKDWLASPERRDEYGAILDSQSHQGPSHVSFRRADVCKRFGAGSPHYQQPTRRC